MSVTCPCCGSTMPTPGLAALRFISLPPNERRVLDELIAAYPRAITVRQIVDRVWALDPQGGPDTAENAVSVYIHRIRPVLVEFGWTIIRMPGRKSGLVLKVADEEEASRAVAA